MATTDRPVEILSVQRGYARNTFFVRIAGQVRKDYTDQQIINIVDAGGDLTQANVKNNFGGIVTPDNGQYRVVVFFD
jgi:hypothetical protein